MIGRFRLILSYHEEYHILFHLYFSILEATNLLRPQCNKYLELNSGNKLLHPRFKLFCEKSLFVIWEIKQNQNSTVS